jgi:hypothetical protein
VTRVFPVVHHRDLATTLANVELALMSEATGVFLINHGRQSPDLYHVVADVHAKFPRAWLGINCLDRTAAETLLTAPPFVQGIWADVTGLRSEPGPRDQVVFGATCEALGVRRARGSAWNVEFFGSVAFKCQADEPDPARVAFVAAKLGWTVTTSGPGTGQAADLAKIVAMSAAVRRSDVAGTRLALASGITPDNVSSYLAHVDDVLVATGISQDFHTFDAEKLKALVDRVRAYEGDRAVLGLAEAAVNG